MHIHIRTGVCTHTYTVHILYIHIEYDHIVTVTAPYVQYVHTYIRGA